MQRAETNNYYPHLMASKLAVDGNTIATTSLDWINGANLATHTPVFAIITYNSGTLGACVINISASAFQLSVVAVALTTLNATESKMIVSLTGNAIAFTNDPAELMNVNVTVPSVASSTFNVYVYGIRL